MHDLIASLRHSGVQLWLDGDDIRVRAADSTQLSAVLETLRQRKPEIVAALRASSNDIVRLPAAEAYEVSHAQRRLWLLSQVEGASAAYNIPLAVRLEGKLDAAVLQRALAAVVARHESLRTAFISRDGEPFQVVVDACNVDLPVQEVSPTEARRQVREMAETPFDLSTAPLMRTLLLRTDPNAEDWELHLVFHHIVVDGWSLSVIMRELSALYDAFLHEQPSPLAPLRVHYRDYAAWPNERLRGDPASDDARYWIERLAPPLPQLNLPADFARPPLPAFRGELLTFAIDAGRSARLHALAAGHGCTLFMLLAALVKVLLHRITGQEDILIATPVASREHAELEDQVGFYLNTLVLRDRVTSAMTFAELLVRVRQTALDAYEHQHYPFDKLVEDLGVARDVTRSLTDVLVILQNAGTLDLSLAEVRATPLASETGASKNDLTFDFVDGNDGLLIGIRYAADLFTRARIERMTGHFRELADAVLRDAEMPVGRLALLPADEYAMVTKGFNDTTAPFDLSKSIVDLIDEQAARTPDLPAVSFEGSTMTYRELTALSNAIAAHVHRAAGSGAIVGLFVERSLHTVAALLGIMRAGCAYVPLDPANPPRRLAHMLRDAAPPLLLAGNTLAGRVIDLVAELNAELNAAPRVLWFGDIIEQEPPIEELPHIDPDSLAYILYTSGSTGVPKGVEIEHRGLTNELLSMRERPGLDVADTLLAVATISFDIAGLDLYLPLLCGAHVVVASSSLASDGLLLAERLRRGDITVLQATPGTWRMLLNAGWEGSPRLKILCGGEPLTRELAAALVSRCRSLWNLYGPTETTIWSTAFDVTAALTGLHASASIPVGGPIHNASVYIVDAELQPVPIGVPGEVCIGGAGVGRGYRNLPELTAKHYVANPFAAGRLYRTGDSGRFLDDGTLEIFGRLDQQVKVRGFRVETGEVESALLEHEDVRDAVVVVRSDDRGEATLVAYVIASPFDGSALRDHLARRLPPYMIPSAFVTLDALPLAPTGKVDRAALPPPESFARPATGIAARDEIETAIAAAWAGVLQLPALSIDDNFFDAGGHSLKATRALFRLQRELQMPLTLIDLFRNPTVAAFAALVRSRAGGPQ
jgi:amino acid adenylation domain-containing protein